MERGGNLEGLCGGCEEIVVNYHNDIGDTMKIEIGLKKITLFIKPRLINILSTLFIFLLLSSWTTTYYLYDNKSNGEFHWIVFFSILSFFAFLYTIGNLDVYEIDLVKKNLIKKATVFGFCVSKDKINWTEPYTFKYEIVYDSEDNNMPSTWLVVISSAKEKSQRLIEFYYREKFTNFQEIFNENFPEHKVLERHNSKLKDSKPIFWNNLS